MTPRTTRPQCVLLDANIVIETHKLRIWAELKAKYELILPGTVVMDEAKYFRSTRGRSEAIRLGEEIIRGEVRWIAATAEEYAELYRIFDSVLLQSLDPGEAEALALLLANRTPAAFFCTSDAAAIKALAMLGLSDRGISMETLLGGIGLVKRLEPQFTRSFFRMNSQQGQIARITGEGLRKSA